MKRNKIVLYFLLIGIILFLIAIVVSVPKNLSPQPQPETPTPTPILILTPITSSVFIPKDSLVKKLPITTNGYTIQYLPNSNLFIVTILLDPCQKYQNEVISWFKTNGVEDVSLLNIQWGSLHGLFCPNNGIQ